MGNSKEQGSEIDKLITSTWRFYSGANESEKRQKAEQDILRLLEAGKDRTQIFTLLASGKGTPSTHASAYQDCGAKKDNHVHFKTSGNHTHFTIGERIRQSNKHH
jgi:hypothetical protein